LERLEPRIALTVNPSVASVELGSSAWDSDFVEYLNANDLGVHGFELSLTGSEVVMPWSHIDEIRITFNVDVEVQQSDLSVSGVNTTAYGFSGFSYDSQTFEAVWTLAGPIANDVILIDVDGDGLDPVADVFGRTLEGGDFELVVDILAGDANDSGAVSISDFFYVYALVGLDTEDAAYDPMRDINGSGAIDASDYLDVYGRITNQLPSGDPAGLNNDAPSTSGFDDLYVYEDAVDAVLSLWSAFEDAEDLDTSLVYQVLSNSNESLFASTTFNDLDGLLTLDFADDAFGVADLVIQATDTNGLVVETTLHVDVEAVNDAPVISDFEAVNTIGDFWTFTGVVSDVDDDPTGWLVEFWGVIPSEYTATVATDGSFSLTVELPNVLGTASAQTEDDGQLASNTVSEFIASA
jgi:hypothetical protein